MFGRAEGRGLNAEMLTMKTVTHYLVSSGYLYRILRVILTFCRSLDPVTLGTFMGLALMS